MEETSKKEMMMNICEFYLDFLKNLYDYNSALDLKKYVETLTSEIAEQKLRTHFKKSITIMFSKSSTDPNHKSLALSKTRSIFSEELA